MQDTFGPPLGKKLLMFVDDVNMPRVDTYGTQQPIALLKLFAERKGFYDRGKELGWKNVKDVQMVGAMGPPGGARNNVDPRFISLFSVFEIQAPSNSNLRTIYQVGVAGPLSGTALPWCWQDVAHTHVHSPSPQPLAKVCLVHSLEANPPFAPSPACWL